MSIYLVSDWHFCHNRSFIYEPRGFSSVEEMNETIIKNHNEIVKPEDTVYCLGDCMLNDNEAGCNCIRRLNGRIFILTGNHDNPTRIQKYANIRYDIIPIGLATMIKYGNYNFYLSHYPTLTSNFDDDKPLKRKVIGIAGHCHTKNKFKDMDKGLIYHVELDAHDNKPVLIDNIIKDIKYFTSLKEVEQKRIIKGE